MGPSTGPGAFGLSIARVVRVDQETHEVTLQVLTGENDLFQRTAVPLTQPSAGARHFMGSLPHPGDVCIVGWLTTSNKTPVILGWIPPGLLAGLEWLPVQDFLPVEADLSPKVRSQYEGIYGRRRHKMKPMRRGEVYLSSGFGSDVILDEGVTLTNRRGTELRLRDQDQAILARGQARFDILGGTRVYAGPVQRDALFLPYRTVQDGVQWDAPRQANSDTPIDSSALPTNTPGKYVPHPVFDKTDPTSPFFTSGFEVDANLDPYSLLTRGLWIGPDGYLENPSQALSDVEYGGKSYARTSLPADGQTTPPINAALPNGEALTEYRIEIQHTHDGTLPVSEQTEGFDADRLPSTATQDQSTDVSRPLIEWVLGSVVGNNPFSRQEKGLYGLPLQAKVFDGPNIDPRLESAVGETIGHHAATLFRITPPLQESPPAFVSFTKDGAIRAYLTGPPDESSLDLALTGGVHLQAGGPIQIQGRALKLDIKEADPASNMAFQVASTTGAVKLSAGGPSTLSTASSKADPQPSPALLLEAPTSHAWLTAGRTVRIAAGDSIQVGDAQEVSVSAKRTYRLYSDKGVLQYNTLDRTVQGKETTLYVGPKNSLPSNGPAREVSFGGTPATGQVGGTVDEYTVQFGDRKETFKKGNHTTQILVGDLTYETGQGSWKAKAGTNTLEVSSTQGIQGDANLGPVKFTSTTTATFQGQTAATVKSSGLTRVSGSSVILGANGATGSIINSSDLDPLTNLPLSFFGMGSQGHLLGPSI